MKAAANHTLNYGAAGVLGVLGLMLLDRYGLAPADQPTRDAIAAGIVLMATFLVHRLRPIVDALFTRLTKWAAGGTVALLLCTPSIAEATDARIVLECSKTTTIAPSIGPSVETCLAGDETLWLDMVVGAQVVAIQLTGERKVVELGAAPSLGLLLAWRPTWWTATKVLIGAEAIVSATVLSLDRALSHLEIWTVGAINLLGYLSIGIGGRYGIATTEEADDFAELVLTSGLRVPI